MKSVAPAAYAASIEPTSSRLVAITIGTWRASRRSRSRRHTPMPSSPGISTSRMTRSGWVRA
jgi:hypothetical protein